MLFLLQAKIGDYAPVIIQILVTAGVIFGGTGFWQWKQAKDQAKRDKQNKENGVGSKVDSLSTQITDLNTKLDTMSNDLQHIKHDIELLENANAETIKYRQLRDKQDKAAIKAQQGVINSLKGILRERLLDNYKKCIKKGYYSKEEREIFGEMFQCYESEPFNGNGVMHQLRPIMQAMPWKADDVGKKTDEDD